MTISTFVLVFITTLAVSLPSDWARRQEAALIGSVGTSITVLGVTVVVLSCAAVGLIGSASTVIAMVAAIVIGSAVGDAMATRLWGRASV